MKEPGKSTWDAPGVAAHIEACWEAWGSDDCRREVAGWMGPQIGRFLDLGCGSARMAQFLEGRYVGVDASEEMLRIAKTRVPPRNLRLADLTGKLPFANGSFEAALCMEVIRHLPSYEPALSELARLVTRKVHIVDVFHDNGESSFGQEEILSQTFPNNCWSLPQFLADVAEIFPGWTAEIHPLSNGELAIRIEAPWNSRR